MKEINYYIKQEVNTSLKVSECLKNMPDFCKDFIQELVNESTSSSQAAYLRDLNIFFTFVVNNVQGFDKVNIIDLTLNDLEKIKPCDIELYLNYLDMYSQSNNKYSIDTRTNDYYGKHRKLSSLRMLYKYLYKKGSIKNYAPLCVELPKRHENHSTCLNDSDVEKLMNEIELGENLTDGQKRFHNKTKKRDFAIVMLLLNSGIRVSECVAINMTDVDFEFDCITVIRKNGVKDSIYMSVDVKNAMKSYIEERKTIQPLDGHEEALFLSIQKKRIAIRSIQMLVKKYSHYSLDSKPVTPHSFRTTYGSRLYRDTSDLFLVSETLGIKDINITKNHYTQI